MVHLQPSWIIFFGVRDEVIFSFVESADCKHQAKVQEGGEKRKKAFIQSSQRVCVPDPNLQG